MKWLQPPPHPLLSQHYSTQFVWLARRRLEPPLTAIPKGEWFCPCCIKGTCFFNNDPRLGKTVGDEGVICRMVVMGDELMYMVKFGGEINMEEPWSLDEVDAALGGNVPKLLYKEACIESHGYFGKPYDSSKVLDVLLTPNISAQYNEKAAVSMFQNEVSNGYSHQQSTTILTLFPSILLTRSLCSCFIIKNAPRFARRSFVTSSICAWRRTRRTARTAKSFSPTRLLLKTRNHAISSDEPAAWG